MSGLTIAVLQFPGLNCEVETARALEFAGLSAAIVRWNESGERLARFGGFVIPGGFSYQDRVRAGVIASKSDLVEALAHEAEKGKPVLGICNGAQILVEAGLVPGREAGKVEMALAANRIGGWEGYHSRWIFVRPGNPASCFFTEGLSEPLPMVVAHAEGRFVSADSCLIGDLQRIENRALVYCDDKGEIAEGYPDNPNGSQGALAAMAGLDGQVLAMMPHPERAAWLWQIPEDIAGIWGKRRQQAIGDRHIMRQEGPGIAIFRAFHKLNKVGAS